MHLTNQANVESHQSRGPDSKKEIPFLDWFFEALVLLLVFFSPWPFASVHPFFEMVLYVGLAVVIFLWSVKILIGGRMTWKYCPVTSCLLVLFLYGSFQLIPLPRPLLAWLSPAAVEMYDRLLPAEPEVLPTGETVPPSSLAAGSTLSLYPEATRVELLRLLAVLLLFVVVRNTFASTQSLKRLAFVSLFTGFCLSFFALIQLFSAPPHQMYWTFQTAGGFYGPFICRNHYPFYLNLCIGLGSGLFLSAFAKQESADPSVRFGFLGSLLNNSKALWLLVVLVLMVISVCLSLSRGGMVALALGMIFAAGFHWLRKGKKFLIGPCLLLIFCAFGFIYFVESSTVGQRVETMWNEDDALEKSRLPIWRDALSFVDDFPVWGTGYGMFTYLESIPRGPKTPIVKNEFCHNDYLESLFDGGIIKLGLVLLLMGSLVHLGLKAYARHQDKSTQWLVLGSMLGISAVAFHSFVDFGLHIPAVTLFTTVVCAHIAAIGASRHKQASSTNPKKYRISEYTVRLGGLSAVFFALLVAGLGLLLAREGWRLSEAERYRLAARGLEKTQVPEYRQKQIAYLQAAVAISPNDAKLHIALADAQWKHFEEQRKIQERLFQQLPVVTLEASLLTASSSFSPFPAANVTAGLSAFDEGIRDPLRQHAESRLVRNYLTPALQHYIQARDLCPFLPLPNVRLAAYRDWLPQADSRLTYLERATYLHPVDSELWYLVGVENLAQGESESAWASWKKSLQNSDQYFDRIFEKSSEKLGPQEMVRQVFPDDPELLLKAADRWKSLTTGPEKATPFLQKALSLVDANPSPEPKELFLKGKIQHLLGQPENALDSYRQALVRDPENLAWRMEVAELLFQEEKFREALEEVNIVLNRQPENRAAQELKRKTIDHLLQK